MKTIFVLVMAMMLNAFRVYGQVSISEDGSQPNPAAILELKSTEKGFLPPRLNYREIWELVDPPAGLMVFNTDTGKLIVYDGTNWHVIVPGDCVPPPSAANAGIDQVIPSGDTLILQAEEVLVGSGAWTVVSGSGGIFSDIASPSSLFWGDVLEEYTLRWTVSTGCDTIQDEVIIEFDSAIFVSKYGNDENPGTRELPVLTIQQAITNALAYEKTVVNIAQGTYGETVNLVSSLHLYGGYDSVTWTRDPATYLTVISGGTKAVIGSSVNDAVLDGMTIQGADASNNGTGYGVFLTNCNGISISACSIVSGIGAYGLDGVSGVAGANANSGTMGQPGCENSTWPCETCSQPQGGPGGSSTFGCQGGSGGSAGLGPSMGNPGVSGSGTGAGAGGQGGTWGNGSSCQNEEVPGYPANGSDGQNGSNGGNGSGGATMGVMTVTGYNPSNGGAGGIGVNGGGGGGGGGGCGGTSYCDSYGSGGGGGGAGGQRGTGGSGGTGGGGSFAVWCFGSQVTVYNCNITTGNGGNGGSGGTGGQGGDGGYGYPGGYHTEGQEDGGCGGYGGNGGHGGQGGHGGGGGGGPAIGIVKDTGSTVSQSGNIFDIGTGGTGGTSSGNAGQNGLSANTNF